MKVDLVVKNGLLVTPRGIVEGGVAIDDGVIVTLAKSPHLPEADRVIDARGRPVLPGLIDGHPHTTSPPDSPATGTRAAARGGFTTLLEMPGHQVPTFSPEQFTKKRELYERSAFVDFSLHGARATLTRLISGRVRSRGGQPLSPQFSYREHGQAPRDRCHPPQIRSVEPDH